MIEYLKANFDLTEVISFNFNVQSSQLTIQGKDELGRLATRNAYLSRIDAARLFRLYITNLPGMD